MTESSYAVEFFDDAGAYLRAGERYFEDHPVEVNVITVVADRVLRDGPPEDAAYCWFALVRDGEEVVGAAMRSAPFAPYPMYVSSMPSTAARELARAVVGRGEEPGGANGSLPAAQIVAETAATLLGLRAERAMPTRLWALGTLVPPTGVPGAARFATETDEPVCRSWFNDFRRAADEQSGRSAPTQEGEHQSTAQIMARIDERRIVLWECGERVVHLTGLSYPVFGVGRIGPVYTPVEHRGHGYAAAAVAYASQLILDAGGRRRSSPTSTTRSPTGSTPGSATSPPSRPRTSPSSAPRLLAEVLSDRGSP